MADIESNIKVNIDTSEALAQLKLLQQQISAFQQAMRNAGSANAKAAAAMQQNLVNSINATGKFRANIQTIKTSAETFTESLEKNKMSIGEYFRYAGGASKTFGKLFKSEFAVIQQVAEERVKALQTQFIKLGRDANGAMKAIAVKPLALDMDSLAVKTQLAAQRQQLFNQLMKQGSTQLLNFGKNTQWAGRQLMVGFTIPLTMMGAAAAKAYMQIEAASIKFKRVYGDINTTTTETNKMVKSVQALANEFTKYGLAVADTMEMAASAAAMGKTGADLLAQIDQAAKLSILGGVEQQQALETTISLTNAFSVSTQDLARSVDFLNAVENQTVVSIEDLTIAIPKAAPVVKQLGGDVKDLAFFLTAMKEGGINASEGANALKSGLASMINPTAKASQFLQKFGINLNGIVEANKGNVRGTVVEFAKALDTLDPLNRARAIEQLFGKFQFSRLSTLFQNVIADGSQATKVAQLANQTAEELAVLSEREMKKVESSPMFKFQKSIQDMQAKLAPVGEAFLKAVTPIIEFVSKILDGFNNLSEGSKQFVTILVTAVAGIGPILLMTFGLIANGVANIMKLFTNMKSFINKTTKPSEMLGEQTEYMNTEQLRAAAIAASLDQAHAKLKQTFDSERIAVEQLTQAYRTAVNAQQAYAGVPGVPVGNPNATPPQKYAGGVRSVPGPKGAGDIVPALLSPGEAVIPAKQAQKYAPVIHGMIAGNLPGFEKGTTGVGQMRQSIVGPLTQRQTEGLARTGMQLEDISNEVLAGPYGKVAPTNYGTQISPTTGHSFPAFGVGGIYLKPDGTKVFVKPQMDLTSAMAEMRGTEIARGAHGLQAPQQKIGVMMDPTDPQGRRRFIVLESPVDEKFANIPTSFTKDQYFKQLVASLLRGDKDLGLGNLGGDILADVGTAGVFQRASGKRELGGKINSMEEQAIINLLGVKGGAKRFFAEATSEIASSMSPSEYDAAMKAEIQAVMPRLQATIAGFGNMSSEEKAAYQNMLMRLQSGMSVDWGKYQVMHSAVPPKKYNEGTVAAGWEGLTDTRGLGWLDALGISTKRGIQRAHLQDELSVDDPMVLDAIRSASKSSVNASQLQDFKVLGNLTADLPEWVNQKLIPSKGGIPSPIFIKAWNSIKGKMLSSAKAARLGSEVAPAVQEIEDQIGRQTASLASQIFDPELSQATRNVLLANQNQSGELGVVANAFARRAELPGTLRADFGKNAHDQILLGLQQGRYQLTPSGKAVVMTGTRGQSFRVGELRTGASSSSPEGLRYAEKWDAWDRAGRPLDERMPTIKSASAPKGMFSGARQEQESYEATTPMFSKIMDFSVFFEDRFMRKNGYALNPATKKYEPVQKYANGVYSVPGPKGAGDVVPAMLSPGEAVIPAKQAQKYQPLIQQMVHGKIPGYRESNVPKLPSIPGVEAPTPYVAPEPGKAATFLDGIKNAVSSGAQKLGATVVEKSKSALETALVPFVRYITNDEVTLKDDKGTTRFDADTKESFDAKGNIIAKEQVVEKTREVTEAERVAYMEAQLLGDQEYQQALERVNRLTEMQNYGQQLTAQEQAELDQKQRLLDEKRKYYREAASVEAGQGGATPEKRSLVQRAFTRNKFTGRLQGLAYGASAVAGVASTMGGSIGEAAQAALPSIGAFTTAMSMIPGPAGVAVGALAAVVTIFNQIQEHLKKMREESYKLASAMGAGNQSIQKFAEFAKTVSATEIMNKRREASAGQFFNVVEGKKTFGESYMETDAGKQLLKDINDSVKQSGGELSQAKALITQQLSAAIAAGVLTTAQARSIAANLGKQLKSTDFGLTVTANITNIFGPNGENLKENPLEVTMSVSKKSATIFKDFAEMASENFSRGFGEAEKIGGSMAAQLQSMLDVQQQMVDSLQVIYEKRIASARKAGDEAKAIDLQNQLLIEQQKLLNSNKAAATSAFADLKALDPSLIGQFKEASIGSIESAYKGTGMEGYASIAKDQINAMQGTDAEKGYFASLVGSKTIGLPQVGIASEMFGDTKEGATKLNDMLLNIGGVETNRALGLTQMMSGETKKKFMLEIGVADPAKAKAMNDALELVQKTTGPFADDDVMKTAIMNFAVKNADKVADAKKNIDALQGLSGQKITVAVTTGSLFDKNTQAAIKKDIKRFNKYNDAGKITYTTELQQIMKMSGDKDMINAFKLWRTEQGDPTLTFQDYAIYQADRTVRESGIDQTTGPGSQQEQQAAAIQPSVLDQFVQMLREGSNWQQKLTVGWNASYKALKNYTEKAIFTMGGFAVMLKNQGVDSNIIDIFMGATEEEQNKVLDRRTGKLKAGALSLLKELKKIKDMREFGLAYVLASPMERLEKDNQLYQAGLDVISEKEKAINKRYDERIKALDEIGKIQEKNNQRQKDTLDLADALSKGDIAAAARVALTARQNSQKQALEEAKASLELARKNELATIEVNILGSTRERSELEAMIATNSEKIAGYKLDEANRQAEIARDALAASKHVAQMLKDGKALSMLPGYNATGNPGGNPTTDPYADLKKSNIGKVGFDAQGNAVANQYTSGVGAGYLGNSGMTSAWDFKNKKWTVVKRDPNQGKEGYVQDEKTPGKYIPVAQSGKKMGQYQYATRAEAAKTLKAGEKVDWVYDQATNFGYYQTTMAASGSKENPTMLQIPSDGSSFDKPTVASIEKGKYFSIPKNAFVYGVIKDGNKYRISYGLKDPGYGEAGKNLKSTGKGLLADDSISQVGGNQLNYKYYDQVAGMDQWTSGYFPIKQFARGGMVYASRGIEVESSKYALGTDTIPAMLTPGEFVMKKAAVDRIGAETLSAMNDGTSSSESVYNYSITVNANSSDAQGIADAVLNQIKRIDGQRIRSSTI